MRLNPRQYEQAVKHMFRIGQEEGLSESDIATELDSLSDEDLNKAVESTFVDMKQTSTGVFDNLKAAALGAADTQTFGHTAKAAGAVLGTLASEVGVASGEITAEQANQTNAAQVFEEEFEDAITASKISNPVAYNIGQIGGYFIGTASRLVKGAGAVAKAVLPSATKTAVGAVAKATAAGAITGAVQGGVEGALRPDRTALEGAAVGGALGGAVPAAIGGGAALGGAAIKKTTAGLTALHRKARDLSPEVAELMDNMGEIVKAAKGGLYSLKSKAEASIDEVASKFGGILNKVKESTKASFDEQQFASGADLEQTISGLVDETAVAIAEVAGKKNSLAREQLRSTLIGLDGQLSKAGKALSQNYGEALEPILKQADDAGLKIALDPAIDSLIAGLPEGALINGRPNVAMLGKEGASIVNATLARRGKPLSLRDANNFKQAIGLATEWSDEALASADAPVQKLHRAMRDTYDSLKNAMQDGLKTVSPGDDLPQLFGEYHSGLKLISNARSVLSRPRAVTNNYAEQLEFLTALSDNKKYVKAFNADTQGLIKNGLAQTRKIIETQKITDSSTARNALVKALKAPDPQAQMDALEGVVGELAKRRELQQLVQSQKLHPKLVHALKNPLDAEAQKLAQEFLDSSPGSRNIFASLQGKLAKAERLKSLGTAEAVIKDIRATGTIKPEVLNEVEDLASLLPDLQKAFELKKLLALAESPLFKEINVANGLIATGLGAEVAMNYIPMPKWGKNTVRTIGAVLTLRATLNNPIYVARLNETLKLRWTREKLEKIVTTVQLYNNKIAPALNSQPVQGALKKE